MKIDVNLSDVFTLDGKIEPNKQNQHNENVKLLRNFLYQKITKQIPNPSPSPDTFTPAATPTR